MSSRIALLLIMTALTASIVVAPGYPGNRIDLAD